MAGEEEGLFLASFDLSALRKARSESIWGNAFRRPHRYSLLVSPERDDVWNRTAVGDRPYDPSKR